MTAIQIIRQRLLGLGGDYAALANSLSDAQLTQHILGDPTLFVGDPIRDQLATEMGGGAPAAGGGTFGGTVATDTSRGTIGYPAVELPAILTGGQPQGVPGIDWMRFLEARRQFDIQEGFKQLQSRAQMAANPRDWVANWFMRGANQQLQAPPWLTQMTGATGAPGQNVPYPWQLSLPDWMQLRPSEQQGLQGFYSSLGWSPEDVESSVQQTRPLASSAPGGGVFRWNF